MIEAGEDPRFIARRLVISAAEDIGLADPQALQIAVAAADAVAFIGMPEGRIPLAEATVYLATTAKSNAAYNAINAAIADVRAGGFGRVPVHLRDAHYAGAKRLGHGKGYKYAHDSDIASSPSSICPTNCGGSGTTSRRRTARNARSPPGSRRSAASSTAGKSGAMARRVRAFRATLTR